MSRKLKALTETDGDIGMLRLADVLDADAIQSLMNDFFSLTGVGIGIIDLEGNVLVATGWQDICTAFHRLHPESCRHCIESDTELSAGVPPGAVKLYRCKNGLWDMVTPITVGDRHVGNIFLGQFHFLDEQPDLEFFRAQARRYGFDEETYLAALQRVPRWSREKVERIMAFYAKLARQISELSYGNIRLARTLAAHRQAEEALERSHDLITNLARQVPGVVYQYRLYPDGRSSFPYASAGMNSIYEVTPEEVREDATPVFGRLHPDDHDRVSEAIQESARTLKTFYCEFRVILPRQGLRWRWSQAQPERTPDGGTLWYGIISDITERKLTELSLEEKLTQLERINKLMIGRENRMIELKRDINDLCRKANLPPRFPTADSLVTGSLPEGDRRTPCT